VLTKKSPGRKNVPLRREGKRALSHQKMRLSARTGKDRREPQRNRRRERSKSEQGEPTLKTKGEEAREGKSP